MPTTIRLSPPPASDARGTLRQLSLSVHEASDSGQLALYRRCQRSAYRSHGVLAAAKGGDAQRPSLVRFVALTDGAGVLVGGLEVHRRGPRAPLPVEDALGKDKLFATWIQRHARRLTVELSGTAVRPGWRKRGLTPWLIRAGVAVGLELGAKALVGFGHQHVLQLYGRWGFVPTDLPVYPYPNPQYASRVARVDLSHAEGIPRSERRIVEQLRAQLAASERRAAGRAA